MHNMFLLEYDRVMINTHKMLEHVTDDLLPYKPHTKSFTTAQLCGHIIEVIGWHRSIIHAPEFIVNANHRPYTPAACDELMEHFEEESASVRTELITLTNEQLMQPWTFKENNYTVFTVPRILGMCSVALSHIVHHRAQLSLYLRLNNRYVPGMYGPSADEKEEEKELRHHTSDVIHVPVRASRKMAS